MNIVLTQDFFPQIGGAHYWLYEVYKNWPSQVTLLAQDYKSTPSHSKAQDEFDAMQHGSLLIKRHDIAIDNINLLSLRCLLKYKKNVSLLSRNTNSSKQYIHSIRAFPEGIAAAIYKILRFGRCKIITYAHGEEILVAQTSRQLKILSNIVYRLSDLIIVNSKSTRSLLNSFYPKTEVIVSHPGVDFESFQVTQDERLIQRAKWGWPEDTIIMTTIARLEPRKNHTQVIKALASLRSQGLKLAYVIGGDGDEMANLKKLVNELDIHKWINFRGRMTEAERILTFASADIHVMPSIIDGPMIEGFGIVFLEAAAAGIPSISGNSGGQPEAVLHNKTGLVIDGKNIEELKNAIKKIAEVQTIRKYYGEQGLKWAKENDWSKVTSRIYKAVNAIA